MIENETFSLSMVLPYSISVRMSKKYKDLAKIFTKEEVLEISKSGKIVNMFIDIEPILRSIATDQYWMHEVNIPIEKKESIVLYGLISLVGHYKNYFHKLRLDVNIITFYGLKKPSMLDFTGDLNVGKHRIREYIESSPLGEKTDAFIKNVIKLYVKICGYTNKVNNINSGDIFRPTMCHMAMNALDKGKDKTNVIITSDKLLFSLGLPDYNNQHHKTIVFDSRDTERISVDNYYTKMHGKKKGDILKAIPGSYLYHTYIDSISGESKQNIKSCAVLSPSRFKSIKSIIESDSTTDIEEKFISLIDDKKRENYLMNLRIYNPVLMSSLATEESRESIRSQTMNYTNPDIHEQLVELLYRLDPEWVQYKVTAFVR